MASLPLLRLNQGDASEARIYYAAHLVAARLDYFKAEGVEVAFTRTASGGASVRGGQIPALLDGSADLTIGGPMVTMRMVQDGEAHLVSFCAATAANPWVLAGRQPEPDFTIAGLRGRRVLDMAGIGTATFAFRTLLAQSGLAEGSVNLLPSQGTEAADLAFLEDGRCDYVLHSLHALCSAVARERLVVVADLARLTGPVPWSAYIARPERIAAAPLSFAAFTRAIARALTWIATQSPGAVARLIGPDFPEMDEPALETGVAGYQRSGVFATTPLISAEDFARFGELLLASGWLSAPPVFRTLVDTDLASAAVERMA